MSETYGYIRCSTKKQSAERQYRNISAVCPTVKKFYFDAYTGTTMDRKEWNKLMKQVKPDDIIIFDSVSRMSRNAQEGIQEYTRLYEMGVHLKFLKEPHIDTDVFRAAQDNSKMPLTGTDVDLILDGIQKYLMAVAEKQILLAFEQSEKEVVDLRQRTREGMITAKANGKTIGREAGKKYETKKSQHCKKMIRELSREFEGNLHDSDIIPLLGIARHTFYKYKNEMKYEDSNPEKL